MSDTEGLLREISQLYANLVNIAIQTHDAEEPMTATQRLALIEVVEDGPMRARDVAERLATTRATATRAVDGLEELGYVERRASPDDARGVLVRPTARGRRWVEKRQRLVRKRLEQLPPEVAAPSLIRDLAILNAALRAQIDGADTQSAHLIAN